MNPVPTETDEDVQRQLGGEAFHGPRTWQGRPLAPLSRGLRECFHKVMGRLDSDDFMAVALLTILADAHATKPEEKLARRTAVVLATDAAEVFRGGITMALDDLDDAAVAEARTLAFDLLGLIEKAEAVPTDGKKKAPAVESPPMTTPSSAGRSRKRPAGPSTTSAGN